MADNKHVAVFSQKHLKDGESLKAWGDGYIGEMMGTGKDAQKNGVLIATGERVVFYRKGLLGEVIESIPLKLITSIERRSMMGHNTIRLHTSHDALTFKTFNKVQEDALVKAIEVGRSSYVPMAPVADISQSSSMDAIRQLANLRDEGLLTEEEFLAKKTEILARI